MTPARRALIVIDAQQEYFTGRLRIQYPPRDESIQRINDAIDAAERVGIPVVMVQHAMSEGAPAFSPSTPQFRLHSSLEERDAATWKSVVKQYSSIFPGTGLDEWFREQGIDTITLTGYMTNNCVLASAAKQRHMASASRCSRMQPERLTSPTMQAPSMQRQCTRPCSPCSIRTSRQWPRPPRGLMLFSRVSP